MALRIRLPNEEETRLRQLAGLTESMSIENPENSVDYFRSRSHEVKVLAYREREAKLEYLKSHMGSFHESVDNISESDEDKGYLEKSSMPGYQRKKQKNRPGHGKSKEQHRADRKEKSERRQKIRADDERSWKETQNEIDDAWDELKKDKKVAESSKRGGKSNQGRLKDRNRALSRQERLEKRDKKQSAENPKNRNIRDDAADGWEEYQNSRS